MQNSLEALRVVASSQTVPMAPRARLPFELWAMTIGHMRDRKSQAELAYLWTTVRRVSKAFEQEIEKLFLEEHLEKTWIHVDCGKRSISLRDGCPGLPIINGISPRNPLPCQRTQLFDSSGSALASVAC